MLRRFFLSCALLIAGFTAGMVLTARSESRAGELAFEAPPPAAAEQTAARPSTAAVPAVANIAASGGLADFSKIAGQAVKGVANISSLQVVRTSNSPFGSDPFFRYFYDDDRAF